MGVPTMTQAERALRRAVNPLSTAITLMVQDPRRRRRPVRAGRWGSGTSWPPMGPDGQDGGAGVREPRRPLPTMPSDAAAVALPD